MTCAKTTVVCTLVLASGERVVGTNWCRNPQKYCPRKPGEGYEKCKSICDQAGHAEEVAAAVAGPRARGATAYIQGHTYACDNCRRVLSNHGVDAIIIGAPPAPSNDTAIFDELNGD